MASLLDMFEDEAGQEGGTDAPVSPGATGAIDSPKPSEEKSFTEVIKPTTPEASKMEQLASIPGGWMQETLAGLGDMATTAKVNAARRNYQEELSDPRAFNEAVVRLPFKKRIEFSKAMKDMDQDQRVEALAEYFEADVKSELVERYQRWHDDLGESRPPITTGILSHVDQIGRGLFRSAPVMGANMIGSMGGKPGGIGAGMAAGYMLYKGNKYEEYVGHDVDKDWAHEVSDMAAWSLASVESMSDLMQVNKVLSRFKNTTNLTKIPAKVADGFVKGMLKGSAAEGMEEYSQAHIEVMFDVLAAGGRDLSGEEWAKRSLAIIASPEFQRGAWQQLLYGAAGGAAMQAAGSGVAKVTKGIFQNDKGSVKPKEGGPAPDVVENHGPGKEFIGPDSSEDVRTQSPNTQRPSVDDLMGTNEKADEATPGRTLSEDLTTTPPMAKQQSDNKVSITGILEDLKIKNALKRDSVMIQNNERELEAIGDLYNESIVLEDHEQSLELAEQYKEVADRQVKSVGDFMAARQADMTKKQLTQKQGEIDDAQIYASDLAARAGSMVTSQIQAIRTKENQEFMDWNDELHSKPEVLKASLVQQETESGNLKSPDAKLYRKMGDLVDARRWMADDQFFGKKVKLDKLLETKGDLERKITKEKDDVKVSGYQKAVDDASLMWIDEAIEAKAEYDTVQDKAEVAGAKMAEIEAAEKEQEAAAKAKETASRKKVTGRRADKHTKVNVQKKEERRVATKQTELDKRRAAIQKQQSKIRKPVATPVSESRVDEIEASKARKTAVEKQKAAVKASEKTAPVKGKKIDLTDTFRAQLNTEQSSVADKTYRSAAIRFKGKVYEGASHLSIMQSNQEVETAIINTLTEDIHKTFEHGFVTHDGKFDDRFSASRKLGLKDNYLRSEDLKAQIADGAPGRKGSIEDKRSWVRNALTQPTQLNKAAAKIRSSSGAEVIIVTEGNILQGPFSERAKDMLRAANGVFRSGTNKIYLNAEQMSKLSPAQIQRTMAHEAIHAEIFRQLENAGKDVRRLSMRRIANWWGTTSLNVDLKKLKNMDNRVKGFFVVMSEAAESVAAAQDAIEAGKPFGLQNLDKALAKMEEALTYPFTSPTVAKWLNNIKIPVEQRTARIKTMWDWLLNHMLRAFSIPRNVGSSMDELTNLANSIMQLDNEMDPTARFSKEDTLLDDTVTPKSVEKWTAELDAAAANGIPTEVVNTAADAEAAVGFKVDDNVASIWVPKTKTSPARVVIIASNIQSQDHLVSKWMHEQIGHQGFNGAFPNDALMSRFLDQSYAMFLSQDPKILNEVIELYDIGKQDNKGNRILSKTQKRLAAEEVIARRAEKLKPAVKTGLINKFKNFIRRWLPGTFIGTRSKFKIADADIMSILEMAKSNIMTGENQAGQLLQKALDKRAPKAKFVGWKTLPNFMFPNKTYKKWIKEVEAEAPQVRKWYDKHQDTLHATFGKDADMFNILLSVTSPQADVNTNVIFAVQTYAYMMGLADKPGALFANKLKDKIDNQWTSPEAMFQSLESKLFKVTEFVRGLNGDPDATVGDLWMFRAFFGDSAVYNKEAESYSVPQVVAMRQKLTDIAAEMSSETGDTYTPREVQAAIWIHINAKTNGIKFSEVADYLSGFNKPSAKFGGKTPLEWLQNLVPNLKDGPLSDKIGITNVPMAPISPLAKKRLDQVRKELAAQGKAVDKFNVSEDGTIVVKSTDVDERTLNIIDAISKDGRRIVVPEAAADWHRETFGFKEVSTTAGETTMILSEDAVAVFTNPKGKVTPAQIRDNLGGFSGTYTRTARFSREARKNLDHIKDMDPVLADADYLRTANDGMSVTGKIHEWRDQSELNWNRFTNSLEQDFLDQFGGRKTRISVLGSGRKLNTADTELLQKAMNMYIDSGTGANLNRVKSYIKKLSAKGMENLTNREKAQLMILDRMMNLTEEEIAFADNNIRPYYEDLFNFAQENNIIDSHVDDYVKRTWKMPKEYKDAGIHWSGKGTSGFVLTPTSGKQRKLDSIVDGWELGMDLQTDGVIENLQNYGTELGYVFANRRFVGYMRSLIDFKANPLMIEVNPKTSPDFKPPAGYGRVSDRGFAKPGHIMYARQDFANELNKLGNRPSRQLWDTPVLRFVRRLNAMLKSTILSVSMFHHLAGLRSYGFGVSGKGAKFNGIKAYKRGLKKIDEQTGFTDPSYQHLGPIVDLLVREGLTIGKTQDWDQAAIQESWLEQALLKGTGRTSAKALAAWQQARRKKRSLTGGLFNRLFAGLKAEGAAYELIHSIKKQESKLGRALNDSEIKLTAAQTAALVNADFGGLHLSRMGRNPDLQRGAQMALLAPDWTESNWRTVFGMVPGVEKMINKAIGDNPPLPGMDKVYRKFWKGVAVRGLLTVTLANVAVLSLFGDEDDWEDYGNMLDEQFSMKNFSKGRWLSTPMGPVYRMLGMEDPEKRPLLSVMGHFKDVLKLADMKSLVKHKVSPVARIFETGWSGTDWKGSRFTSLPELIESGGAFTADNQFAKKLTGPEEMTTALSLIGYNIRQSAPIFGSEFLQYLQGESSGLSSLMRAAGIDIRDTRRAPVAQQNFEKISSKINELDRNLKTARVAGDQRMIFEARKDISNYDNFNRTKARIGSTKNLISIENRKLKPLETKEKAGLKLSERDVAKMQQARDRKREIYEKAMTVLER